MEATDVKGVFAELKKRMDGQIEHVRHVFTLVGQSNLLNGRPHRTKTDRRPYKTRFDWVINPENAAKIVEGHFSDEPQP